MEGQRLEERSSVVFKAQRELPSTSEPGFVPFESFAEDDHLVYPVPDSQPALLKLNAKFNSRPFLFEGCVSKAPASILVDSGASVSFASVQWYRRHSIVPTPTHSSGRLADQTAFDVIGQSPCLYSVASCTTRETVGATFLKCPVYGVSGAVFHPEVLSSCCPVVARR